MRITAPRAPAKPRRSAAPLPQLRSCRKTRTPPPSSHRASRSRVPSVEPSSTTTISLSNGTACTRFSSSSTAARSLYTGINDREAGHPRRGRARQYEPRAAGQPLGVRPLTSCRPPGERSIATRAAARPPRPAPLHRALAAMSSQTRRRSALHLVGVTPHENASASSCRGLLVSGPPSACCAPPLTDPPFRSAMSTIVARLRSDVRLRLFLAIVVLPLDRRPVRRCGDPQNRQAAFQAPPVSQRRELPKTATA